jgi:hypothetical protein
MCALIGNCWFEKSYKKSSLRSLDICLDMPELVIGVPSKFGNVYNEGIMRKFTVGIATIAALVLSTLAPMPALAVVAAPSTSFSPATPASVAVGDSVSTASTLTLPADSTLDGVMSQTWDEGRVALGSITSPTGWGLEYQTGGTTWDALRPTASNTITGVRASATNVVTGPGTPNGNRATASALSSVIVADASNIASASRGDGWDVILTPKYVVNVYHHNYSNYELECHVRSTGALCGDLYTVPGATTSNGSSGTYYGGKVFSYVVANGAASVICTNVTSLPFTSCGITEVSAGVGSATGNLGTQVFDGSRIWSAETANGKLLCFNVTTNSSCGATALPGMTSSGTMIPVFTSYIGGKVYFSANKIFCITPATGLACDGTWPADTRSSSSGANVVPRFVAGQLGGVCAFAGDVECFDLSGASVDAPAGYLSVASGDSTRLNAMNGYFETNAFVGTKVYWATQGANGTIATCYDWATDALCAGFTGAGNVNAPTIGNSRYALRVDPNNTACIWTNGDDGVISNFNAATGEIGCPITSTRGVIDYDTLPRYSCSAITGFIRTFDKITFTGPVGFALDDLRVTVINGNGNAVTGFESVAPNAQGVLDLSTLQVIDTTSSFRFILESVGFTNEQAGSFGSTLSYTVDPVELCVTLVQVRAICPAEVGTATSIDQPSFTVNATASYSIASAVVQTNTASATYQVDPIAPVTCYNWLGFTDADGNGIDTLGDDSQVTTIVFGPDGRMYAGGVFQNAGGDPLADNLAVWDGTDWAAVGPRVDGNGDPITNAAIQDRVADIVFTEAGELIVTGHFSNAGGVDEADYVAIYNLETNTWRATGVELNNSGRALTIDGNGTVFVAGTFSGKVKAFNPADATAAISIATLNSNTLALSTSPSGQVYAGGQFNNRAKKYDAANNEWIDVSQDPALDDYMDDYITDIAFDGTKVYFVGLFSGVAVLDTVTDTFSWLGGTRAPSGDARGVTVDENHNVYVAGGFNSAGSVAASNATMFDGANWHSFVDGSTSSNDMSDVDNWGDWRGAWEVTVSPSGNAIFGGDFMNVAGKTEVDYIAYFAPSELVLSPAVRRVAVTEVVYKGPVIQNYSKKVVEKGNVVKVDGKRLAGLQRAYINGKECVVTQLADNTFTITMPDGVEPGTHDLVLHGSFGVLTDKSVLTFGRSSAVTTKVNLSKVFSGFAADSPVLTTDLKKRIAAFVKTATTQTKMVCIGSTSNKVVTAFDRALATKRATVTCNYAKSLKADLVTSIKITPSSATSKTARKSTILLTH